MNPDTIQDRVKTAEGEYADKRAAFDAKKASMDSEEAELSRLESKRDELNTAIGAAMGKAEEHRRTWRDKIKATAASFASGDSARIPVDLGEPRLSAKMAEALAEEHAAILAEIEGMIADQHNKIAEAAQSMAASHVIAVRAYGNLEGLRAARDAFPMLRRARAIVMACDVSGYNTEVAFVRHVQLPNGDETPKGDELTDGMGTMHAMRSIVDSCNRRAGRE